MSLYLTPSEVAQRWACSTRSVEKLCQSGRLQASKLAGWRIRLSDLEAYEAARRNGTAVSAPTVTREPIRPVFGVLEETGADLPLPERWWELDPAALSAAGRTRGAGKGKRLSAVTKSR